MMVPYNMNSFHIIRNHQKKDKHLSISSVTFFVGWAEAERCPPLCYWWAQKTVPTLQIS